MENIRKINERFQHNTRVGASDIYRKFKLQFDALFNPNEIAKSKEEFEEIYVQDTDFEDKIDIFRNSLGNVASFCVGYTGIGKTTAIRHCFNIGTKNISVYNESRKELVFPAFYDGHNIELKYDEDLAEKLSSVCNFLEKENSDLKSYMRSSDGIFALLSFIENTKPEILDVDPMDVLTLSEVEEAKYKLKNAFQRHKYSYYAIRLKFMIAQKYDKYERFVILLDDIESLPHEYQQDLIRLYLSLFDCMANTDYPEDHEYNINLLICLRPHTLRLFNNNRNIETYPIAPTPITKDQAVELAKLFEKRFLYYTKKNTKVIGNIETWTECYTALETMNKMFSGQYKKMVINLCFMNIREALSYYSKIFANRLWVQRGKEIYPEFTVDLFDYIFNNITIIRAISCNESPVYFDDINNILPCLFLVTQERDYSIYCLLIMQAFYKKKTPGEPYGISSTKMGDFFEDLKSIFNSDVVEDFKKCIYYLFQRRILRKSILDKDDHKTLDQNESIKSDSYLYLSSKGEEMWRMLSQDSVLLELFREEIYRNYSTHSFNDKPSYELSQEEIFLDLLKQIEYLGDMEDDLHTKISDSEKGRKFNDLFGTSTIFEHLLFGVECSLRYSGKMENDQLRNQFEALRYKRT